MANSIILDGRNIGTNGQHTVSRFYLRAFADPAMAAPTLSVVNKHYSKAIARGTRVTSVRNFIYTDWCSGGVLASLHEETFQNIEGEAAPIFRRLGTESRLNGRDRGLFGAWMAGSFLRTTSFRATLITQLVNMLELVPEDFPQLYQHVSLRLGEDFTEDDYFHLLLHLLELRDYPSPALASLHNHFLQGAPFQRLSQLMAGGTWQFHTLSEGTLLTGDSPVVFAPGMGVFVLPLNPHQYLQVMPSRRRKEGSTALWTAAALNDALLRQVYEEVYTTDPSTTPWNYNTLGVDSYKVMSAGLRLVAGETKVVPETLPVLYQRLTGEVLTHEALLRLVLTLQQEKTTNPLRRHLRKRTWSGVGERSQMYRQPPSFYPEGQG